MSLVFSFLADGEELQLPVSPVPFGWGAGQTARPGEIYNVEMGTVTRLAVSLAGIDQVINETPGEGGADEESDASFYGRIHTFLSQPVASGNINHYKQWARSVSGVGNAAVIPLWNGNGTVKVVIASEEKEPLDELIVTQVAQYIEVAAPETAGQS